MNADIQTSGRIRARCKLRRSRALGLQIAVTTASLLITQAASAMPLISELFYDAVGSDDGQSFVELSGEPGASVDGLVVSGINGSNGAVGPTLELTGVFGDDGLFVVADRTGDGTTFVPGADLLLNFDFQNGPDSVVLADEFGVLDSLGYGDFGLDEIFAGEGMPAPDVSAGESLARLFADLDLDDNAIDFVAEPVPTPGFAVFASVPEPGSALLAGVGLIVLGRLQRRPSRR